MGMSLPTVSLSEETATHNFPARPNWRIARPHPISELQLSVPRWCRRRLARLNGVTEQVSARTLCVGLDPRGGQLFDQANIQGAIGK